MKDVETIKPTGLFTNYIYKAIPLAFDESLSYYECLCGLLSYLKDTVIPTVNNNADAIVEVQNLMTQLQNYVANYFNNLDVQDEINNKLDEMAKDGSLTSIIENYVNPIYEEYQNEINAKINLQDSKIESINNKVENATSGSPAGVYETVNALTTADPNHDKIYLVEENGEWYYYNTTSNSWVSGGVYQANGVANKSITYEKLADDINYNFEPDYHSVGNITLNKFLARSDHFVLDDSTNYKVLIINDLKPGEKIYITCKIEAPAEVDAITFFESNGDRISHLTPAPYDLNYEEYIVPENASYCAINCYKNFTLGGYTRTYKVKDIKPLLYNLDKPTLNRLSNKQLGVLSKGYICFVSDDGRKELITNTLPIIEEKNIPFTFACFTDSEVIKDSVKRQQVINAINNYGCAICQHGNTSFINYTNEQLYDFLINEQNKWKTYNIDVNGLCYPDHEHNTNIMTISGSIFNICATGGKINGELTGTKIIYDNETNGERTNIFELYRVSIYSHSIEQLKQSVDYAFNNNKLLILFIHDVDIVNEQATKLKNIIDYCKEKNITFTTINNLDKIY